MNDNIIMIVLWTVESGRLRWIATTIDEKIVIYARSWYKKKFSLYMMKIKSIERLNVKGMESVGYFHGTNMFVPEDHAL